jgi:Spy/CpxP family protein refolding chaperone
MRSATLRALAAGAAILLAYPALAQFPPGGGGRGGFRMDPLFLLLNKSVQDELKLTEDQKTELGKIQDKQRSAMAKAREAGDKEKAREVFQSANEDAKKELEKWKETGLKPDQAKRLKQIQLQDEGARAFTDADVQKELKLTDKQKDEVKEIEEGLGRDMGEILRGGREARGNPEKMAENRKKVEALRKEAMDKVSGLLTDGQKKAWKEMTGEKFEVKREAFGGGGRRRQGAGNGNSNKSGE